ncbi:MAG TPA: ROK family protein [Cyclobacteriaceae bacterium]|nr:ROK family protein [Cyclobacteriaceae bacterium]
MTQRVQTDEKILSIDIGGSRIKCTVLDLDGNMIMEYQRLDTPYPATPDNVLKTIMELIKPFKPYSKVSVGFPGYVRKGIVYTAPNLGTEQWRGFNLRERLTSLLKQDVQVVNDADLHGLGIANGKGLEMVITLGTGVGTALLVDGNLLPHFEISHHPFSKDRDYDAYIGNKALLDAGVEKWNRRLKKVLEVLKTVFNYDHLYISGGNAKRINFPLEHNISVASNLEGIRGGAKLWLKETNQNI